MDLGDAKNEKIGTRKMDKDHIYWKVKKNKKGQKNGIKTTV